MLAYLPEINKWEKANESLQLARVISTWGSSPRPVGSVMLIDSSGSISGSVSGGCVEASVVKELATLEPGQSRKLDYGVSDELAWTVGLSCGGKLQVLAQRINFKEEPWQTLYNHLNNNEPCFLISSIDLTNSRNVLVHADGTLVGDALDAAVITEANKLYASRQDGMVTHASRDYFVQVFPRRSTLFIIGVAHITTELVELAHQFNMETIVVDPRAYFADKTSFRVPPTALIQAYPSEVLNTYPLDAYSYAAILSHDPKIDDNAIELLLETPIAYIGALGSRKNHEKRKTRLKEKGFSEDQINRIHGPIGLSIGAKGAREIALSIMAEIIAVKNNVLP